MLSHHRAGATALIPKLYPKSQTVTVLIVLAMLNLTPNAAQAMGPSDTLAQDRAAIEKQAGCFDVTYDYRETFAEKPGYQLQGDYLTESIEYAVVDDEQTNSIYIQHVLIPDGIHPMKHWRQEWTYQGSEVFDYKSNNLWSKRHLTPNQSAARWTERVLNVDDSPQYECSAPWIHWGDQDYWECEALSPLPRREYTHRHDYNVLDRRNREQINASGWLHEQDNVKTQMTGTTLQPLVKERGENAYVRVADDKCTSAAQWWSENKGVWHAIQTAWRTYYASSESVQLVKTGTSLYESLNDLADDAISKKMSSTEIEAKARAIIEANTAH